jgi:hypothetical protein
MTLKEATEISKQLKDARRRYNQILDGWGSGITDPGQLDTAHESLLAVLCAHQNLL